MIQFRHRQGLGLERGAEFRVGREFHRQDFHRDLAVERDLFGEINRPHSTLRDKIDKVIGRQELVEQLDRRRGEGSHFHSMLLVGGSIARFFPKCDEKQTRKRKNLACIEFAVALRDPHC